MAYLANTLYNVGVYDILESTDKTSKIGAVTCHYIPDICAFGLKAVSDLHPELDNVDRMDVVMGHYPAGTSIWDAVHFS